MNQVTKIEQAREITPIDKLKTNLSSRADEFKTALPSHISFDKFQRTIATAAMSNPDLLTCDRRSLLLAAMKLAQDGLLPDGREAALVPFSRNYKDGAGNWQQVTDVQPMPMAWGLRKKILQSGQVVSLETGLVYRAEVEEGAFIYEIGLEPPIRHRPSLALTDEQMHDDEIVAAYSIARIKNESGGDPYWSVEVMRRAEINRVREMSQTGATTYQKGKNKGKPRTPSGPWVDWFGEMAKKTVLRRHSKVLPMSGDILDTIDRDDEYLAAQGTARLLETEEAGPVRLPSRDDLEQEPQDSEHDPETGEVVTDPATGMTEVDEETARALDAQSEQGAEPEPQDEAPEDDGPKAKLLDTLRRNIPQCVTREGVEKWETEWLKHRATYEDDEVAEIDGIIASQRKQIAEAA